MADKNRLILDNDGMMEGFFADARLLGIMAPMKDYQFCWHLNNSFGMNFRVNTDIEIKLIKKKRTYYFSVYEYEEPTRFLSHYLYDNQFDGEYLLPEFRNLDFLWLMKGDAVSDEALQQTIQVIRNLPAVQWVAELQNEQVKNKQNLVF